MNLIKAICITLAALAPAALSGCATPQFDRQAAWADYKPTQIAVIEKDNASAYCADRRSEFGCAVRLRETNKCVVFVKSGLPQDVRGRIVSHETKQCYGTEHAA